MPRFTFACHGGTTPTDPAEIERVIGLWNDWYARIGDSPVDDGGPCGRSWTVNGSGIVEGGGANPLTGYTSLKSRTGMKRTSWREAAHWSGIIQVRLRSAKSMRSEVRDFGRWPRTLPVANGHP